MKKITSLLIIGAVLVSTQAQSASIPKEIQSLIAKETSLNDKCRGGSGDNPKTMKACTKRDKIYEELLAKGWCFGKEGDYEYEREWQKCQ